MSRIPSHAIQCRGKAWTVELCSVVGFFIRGADLLHWNALPPSVLPREEIKAWGRIPAWLPIAWLCCESGPDGPNFASSILDADPGDDMPALIACDWLEEIAARGKLELKDDDLERLRAQGRTKPWPGWKVTEILQEEPRPGGRSIDPDFHPRSIGIAVAGPIHSWCRDLIESRCLACGGLKDGEDVITMRMPAVLMEPGMDAAEFACKRKDVAARVEDHFNRRERREQGIYYDYTYHRCPACNLAYFGRPPSMKIPEVES